MNILVTGGRGYIGRYIVNGLMEKGHTVVNYNRDIIIPDENPNNIFVFGELNDIPRLLETIKQHEVKAIIHTAAQSHPDVSLEVPLATMEANVMGTVCVYEAARLAGIKRVVSYSSECAYGDLPDGEVTESTPIYPTTPYGVSKATTEMLGFSYNRCFNMDIIALRVSTVYGPGQIMPEYIRDAIRSAVRGERFVSPGKDHKFQLVHVADAADASIKACLVEQHGLHVYNVTSGYQPSFQEVCEKIKELMPEFEFELLPGSIADKQGRFNIEAAQRDLGYVPAIPLADGLQEYIEWLRDHDF